MKQKQIEDKAMEKIKADWDLSAVPWIVRETLEWAINESYNIGRKQSDNILKVSLECARTSHFKLGQEAGINILDWVSKEVSIQPTDRGILHLKSQIMSYIIPLAKEKLTELSPITHQNKSKEVKNGKNN